MWGTWLGWGVCWGREVLGVPGVCEPLDLHVLAGCRNSPIAAAAALLPESPTTHSGVMWGQPNLPHSIQLLCSCSMRGPSADWPYVRGEACRASPAWALHAVCAPHQPYMLDLACRASLWTQSDQQTGPAPLSSPQDQINLMPLD